MPEIFPQIQTQGNRYWERAGWNNVDNIRLIKQLIDIGIDVIAFSLIGIDGKKDIVRQGTRFKAVMDIMKSFNRSKKNGNLSCRQ